MTTIFTGTEGVKTYKAIALRSGLRMWVKSHIKPNRAWTPKAMLRAATSITGQGYTNSLNGHMQAINDLSTWLKVYGTCGDGH